MQTSWLQIHDEVARSHERTEKERARLPRKAKMCPENVSHVTKLVKDKDARFLASSCATAAYFAEFQKGPSGPFTPERLRRDTEMVEAAGIEPASEGTSTRASTCLAYLLRFAIRKPVRHGFTNR